MALDAQSNWNVEMAQPLKLHLLRQKEAEARAAEDVKELKVYNREEAPLPIEIILQILAYIPHDTQFQKTLHACCLISRAWYSAAIPFLYERPHINGSNFIEFVGTVCPSKNAHIRQSALAGFVRRLDMGELVHDGSKSLTARVLGRLKAELVEFRAPQASFSINSFAALSKCEKLVLLDLSLMSAAISIKTLFHTLQTLRSLETLFFPRTSTHEKEREKQPYDWPPKLKALHLAGGIDDFFLRVHVGNAPMSLERLSIQHCPMVYPGALRETLENLGPRLKHLTLRHPMNRLYRGALNDVLSWCPFLFALRISADYVDTLFLEDPSVPKDHPLRILDLDCSPSASEDVAIDPEVIWGAIDDGTVPWLRSVRANARLAWKATATLDESTHDLSELMIALEREKPTGIEPGVWITVS